jgi:1-deoxy-D-xylulose-5-phosphate reductoisomerase
MQQPRLRVAILGSTGSVGTSTLDVLARHTERFEVVALTASTRVDAMLTQCQQWRPRFAVMADEAAGRQLQQRCRSAGLAVEVCWGAAAIDAMAAHTDVDTVMAAIVGVAGLASCLAAARAGKRLLLANKEALVVGGDVFLAAVKEGGATLLPIDSEHSAIFQSLPEDPATWADRVDQIILTASGGPFRDWKPESLRHATPEQACAHPNWVMGRKISVDSATMMNKALEVIEARYLFGLQPEQIRVVLHPQSVIHSMVQYKDHSVLAQLGTPDMRVPIAYGLSWPQRMDSGAAAIDFTRLGALSFDSADSPDNRQRFPGLQLAWDVLRGPPGATAVLNAANEVAVEYFLARAIRFDQIHSVNAATMERVQHLAPKTLDDLVELDRIARNAALSIVSQLR